MYWRNTVIHSFFYQLRASRNYSSCEKAVLIQFCQQLTGYCSIICTLHSAEQPLLVPSHYSEYLFKPPIRLPCTAPPTFMSIKKDIILRHYFICHRWVEKCFRLILNGRNTLLLNIYVIYNYSLTLLDE